jgi:hypothetical protein
VIEPLLGRSEIVSFLEKFDRRVIKGPHTLIGETGRSQKSSGQQRRGNLAHDKADFHGMSLISIGV